MRASGPGARAAGAPGWMKRIPAWVWRTTSVTVFLLAWELYGRGVNKLLMSSPMEIAGTFLVMARERTLWGALLASSQPFFLGLSIAVVTGVGLGVLMGRLKPVDYTISHLLSAVYVVPPVALIPLIMMWFGLGLAAKVFIVSLIAMFPILFSAYDGTRSVSSQHVEIARAYGASEWQIFRDVTVFAALPFIMSGFRQGSGRALIGLIVAELFTSLAGLGALIATYSNTLETARMFVVIILLGLLGVSLMTFGSWLERKAAPWKQSERAW